MVQKRDSGFSALPLCLHSGCASGSHVEKLLLKFLYNTSAGKSLLGIVYNRFRSFRFFFDHSAFFRSFRFFFDHSAFFLSPGFSHHHVGFAALPLCLHSGCASGPSVGKLLLKSLYSKSAGQLLLEIANNRFRSFRFFFPIIPLSSDHSAFFFRSFRFFSIIPLFFVAELCSSPPPPGRRGQVNICAPWPKLPLESAHRGIGNCYFIATPGGLCRVLSGAKIPSTGASAPPLRSAMSRDWAFLVYHLAPSLFC